MVRAVIITGYGVKVGVKKGYLVIKDGNGSREVPLSEVEQVILTTSGISITSRALRLLTDYGVDVVVLDSRGFPVSRLYHPYISRTVDVRRAQYMAYFTDLGIELVRSIAYAKVMNQAKYLLGLARSVKDPELKEVAYGIEDLGNELLTLSKKHISQFRKEVMGIEARAARSYWSALATVIPKDVGFEGRDQDGTDQFNIALNYGYGLLYSECWKALVLAGLDPYAGFLHTDRSGKPTLVFDFVEMFRVVAVDSLLVRLFRSGWRCSVSNGLLEHKSRLEIIKYFMENLDKRFKVCSYDSPSQTLRQWVKGVARDLARSLLNSKVFSGPIFRW